MALSGLEIYKHLPKTNCRDCGFPTCLAFAMQLAAKKVSLDKCPHVSDDAKNALDSASQPPIRLVTIGEGDKKLEVGNETVMFRHEETFYHPTGLGILVEDNIGEDKLKEKIEHINKLEFDRVGQMVGVNLIAIKQTGSDDDFVKCVEKVKSSTSLGLVLMGQSPSGISKAVAICKDKKPPIYAATKENIDEMAKIAAENKVPLVVSADDLNALAELVETAKSKGAEDLILDIAQKPLSQRLDDLTQVRRLALKKNLRSLGFPTICVTSTDDPFQEVAEAATLIAKYASIVIMKSDANWQLLSLLAQRQNIYTDPQKPLQIEAKLYEVGAVGGKSPLIITTNFSLTYYTVASEVEASKIPTYILAVDTEGMSVLTAWAAEKFTAEQITRDLGSSGITEKTSDKSVIIPGYVSVISGKLEETSGWKVKVGPREASGIPTFLKAL